MKFAIGIPTLNRSDLLSPTLKNYSKDFPNTKIYVFDNGKQNISINEKNIELIESKTNLGVAASWNLLCEKIFQNHDYALILNDDIYMGKSESIIESVIDRFSKKGVFATATPDWCAFVMPKTIWKNVGKFDECFYPAYYEDNSYAYRMKLRGVIHYKTPLLNPLIYRSSQTLEKDFSILEKRKKNKELYIKMWGGEPLKEKFKIPYNGKPNN